MGHKWKRHRSSSGTDTGIDLLSTAFGLPTHWDIKRADRKLNNRVVYQYDSDSDETNDSIVEQDSEDACTPHGRSPSRRSAFPRRRTMTLNSLSRKRHQSHRHTSSIESQRDVLKKDIRDSLSVEEVNKERNSKQSRPRLREVNKTSKPPPPGSHSPHNKSQNVQEDDSRNRATFPLAPLMINPVCQDTRQKPSTHARFTPSRAHVITPTPQYPCNFVYRFAPNPGIPTISETSKPKPSTSSHPETHKLLSLQEYLNNAQERLSKEPGNLRLQQDQSDAQQQLNEFMDALVAEKSQRNLHTSTTGVKDVSRKEQLPLKDDFKENVAPNEKSTERETSMSFPPQQQGDQTLRLAVMKNITQSNTIRHHLCSGCGEIRSQQFHEKHPVGAAHKPILNYCSACREMRFAKNKMDHHHFCFGCGKVRSKVFQRKYKVEPGESLLPNYCGVCTNEVRLMEDNNEASVLGAIIREPISEADHEAGNGLYTLSASSQHDITSQRPATQALKKSGKARNVAHLRLSNSSPVRNTTIPVSPAESSPFYPGRRLGSAQRRAQRCSTPHPGEEHGAAPGSLAGSHEYRVPYVEDIFSETGSSELASNLSHMRKLDNEAESTRQGRSHPEESGQADFTVHVSSHKSPRLDKCHIPSVATSISSEGQTDKARHQCQVGYKGVKFQSEQSRNKVPNGGHINEKEYSRSMGVFEKGTELGEARPESRRRSPLAEFERSNYPRYFHDDNTCDKSPQDNTDQPEMSQFSSSRGAFGRKESYFSMFNYSSGASGRSGSSSIGGSNSQSTTKNHYTQQGDVKNSSSFYQTDSGDSSFSSNSGSGETNSNNDQPRVNNTYSRSVFTDYSRSTNNPYYNARRRQYPSSSEAAFYSSWEWTKREQPPTTPRANKSKSFDDRIPEPIVEEPASTPSTPARRTMLLEFKTLDDLHLDLPSKLRDGPSTHHEIDVNRPPSPISRPETPSPAHGVKDRP